MTLFLKQFFPYLICSISDTPDINTFITLMLISLDPEDSLWSISKSVFAPREKNTIPSSPSFSVFFLPPLSLLFTTLGSFVPAARNRQKFITAAGWFLFLRGAGRWRGSQRSSPDGLAALGEIRNREAVTATRSNGEVACVCGEGGWWWLVVCGGGVWSREGHQSLARPPLPHLMPGVR